MPPRPSWRPCWWPGTGAFGYNVPIAIAIALLIGIVVFSYRQTIYAYPKGGGSYIVSKDNLGTLPGLVAGASLLTGYILTVSVSIAAGVANLISLAGNRRGWTCATTGSRSRWWRS